MTRPALRFTRRQFVKSSATIAAATAIPKWYIDEANSLAAPAKPLSANDRPSIGLIGCGGMGRADASLASKFGTIVALSDVDETRLAAAKTAYPKASTYRDFRKLLERDDIHVIICATVDHWHVLVSIAAMRSGKDVYCEKPLTLTIDEGKHLRTVAQETKRILQTGSQQRSDRRFRLACELVRNGRIGQLKHITTILPAGPRLGPFKPSPVPTGLDWDFWMGQTASVPYVKERCHVSFRYWYDYSGGTMTDWGAHHNDIALWGLGLDPSGPVSAEGKALIDPIPEGFSAASQFRVEYAYANGVTHTCRSTVDDSPSGAPLKPNGDRHGVKFEGSDGWIFVTRGTIDASSPELLSAPLPSSATRLYVSSDHRGNLFDCIRTRKQTICSPEIGHRSASLCHLGVIAIRLGRKLRWDPKSETFVNDREANSFVAREMREPWGYDSV